MEKWEKIFVHGFNISLAFNVLEWKMISNNLTLGIPN